MGIVICLDARITSPKAGLYLAEPNEGTFKFLLGQISLLSQISLKGYLTFLEGILYTAL